MFSSPKKTKKKLYAEQRRKQNRLDKEQQVIADVEYELSKYFNELQLSQQENIEEYFLAIHEFIKRKANSLAWKKHAHLFFRNYIKDINLEQQQSISIPSIPFEIKRERPILTLDWILNGEKIDEVIDALWRYWILSKDSKSFSDDEVIGNILISSILYSGLNYKPSLQALLEHLKTPKIISIIDDVNIIFLEPLSPSYGDIFVDGKIIRKSRNFVPDKITRLWLIHFNSRKISTIEQDVDYYIEVIFEKINLPFNTKIYKTLRNYANFNWMQLPNVEIDPALSQCLIENIATCGLSAIEFERFLAPKFSTVISYTIEKQNKVTLNETNLSNDNQSDVENVIKIHKDLLKLIRIKQTNEQIENLIIEYCIENNPKFNDFMRRIILWLISLYKPHRDKVQQIADCFNVSVVAFEKSFQQNQPLADSSIYTYYTRIAEPWMMHALEYLHDDDDINTIINKIYQQIITNTRLADEADQPEFKKSKDQTIKMLKRFHTFQQCVFQAQSFELESIVTQHRPRARIIGHLTFKAFINKLEQLLIDGFMPEHHYKILKLIYILAFRTGMRINEILSLRVEDIEGLTDLSIWIQEYGSKKQGNQHKLKTDSATRTIAVYCLLTSEEYNLFKNHVIDQRLLRNPKLYLFRNWNEQTKLNHHTVTTPFKMIMNTLFTNHDYSFHSFRHTAANHLTLILHCHDSAFVQKLTGYNESESQFIRQTLLRNDVGQNHWFVIAHLLGHIDPSETFKSYIHLSYFIAGYKLLNYHPKIDNRIAKKIMGDIPEFSFLQNLKDNHSFDFKRHSLLLSQLLLKDNPNWTTSNIEEILTKNDISLNQHHDFLKYFAGTKSSKISFELFFKCLNLLEVYHDAEKVSQELNLPIQLIRYWYENSKKLTELKTQKHAFRLFDHEATLKNLIKPSLPQSKEEKSIIIYFFEHIQNAFEKNPTQIQDALNKFLSRVTTSSTGIIYQASQIDELELFYSEIKNLFPKKNWHLLGKDLDMQLNCQNQPLIYELMKSNKANYSTTENKFIRLELYSTKSKRALAAFKFCLHLACIGKPLTVKLIID